MPNELRCDLHGPVSPIDAALIVRGELQLPRTGYLCPPCQLAVSRQAHELADLIDAHIAEQVWKEFNAGEK